MNIYDTFNFHIIHALMVSDNDRLDLLFIGSTVDEALYIMMEDGSVEEVLDYAPSYALEDFRKCTLCMSRFDDGYAMITEMERDDQLINLMNRFFDDSEDAFGSVETLKKFISDFNEASVFQDHISDEEKEKLLDQCEKKADLIWISNVKFNRIEEVDYAIRHMEHGSIPDDLFDYVKDWCTVFEADDEIIVIHPGGRVENAMRLTEHRDEFEKLLNDSIRRNFPCHFKERTLLFFR